MRLDFQRDTRYVIDLTKEERSFIYESARVALIRIADSVEDLETSLKSVMCGRVCDLNDLLG